MTGKVVGAPDGYTFISSGELADGQSISAYVASVVKMPHSDSDIGIGDNYGGKLIAVFLDGDFIAVAVWTKWMEIHAEVTASDETLSNVGKSDEPVAGPTYDAGKRRKGLKVAKGGLIGALAKPLDPTRTVEFSVTGLGAYRSQGRHTFANNALAPSVDSDVLKQRSFKPGRTMTSTPNRKGHIKQFG